MFSTKITQQKKIRTQRTDTKHIKWKNSKRIIIHKYVSISKLRKPRESIARRGKVLQMPFNFRVKTSFQDDKQSNFFSRLYITHWDASQNKSYILHLLNITYSIWLNRVCKVPFQSLKTKRISEEWKINLKKYRPGCVGKLLNLLLSVLQRDTQVNVIEVQNTT